MNLVLSCDFQVVEMQHPVHYQQIEFGELHTYTDPSPVILKKYSDGILKALAMHLFLPGHLFFGFFLLSLIWITMFFLYTLCLTHILSLYCLVVIIFFTYTSCLILISSLSCLVLIVFVAYTSCLIHALDLYTVY